MVSRDPVCDASLPNTCVDCSGVYAAYACLCWPLRCGQCYYPVKSQPMSCTSDQRHQRTTKGQALSSLFTTPPRIRQQHSHRKAKGAVAWIELLITLLVLHALHKRVHVECVCALLLCHDALLCNDAGDESGRRHIKGRVPRADARCSQLLRGSGEERWREEGKAKGAVSGKMERGRRGVCIRMRRNVK